MIEPKHNHRVDTIHFEGIGDTLDDAQRAAQAKLQAWYAQQVMLFTPDSHSVFQFATAMGLMPMDSKSLRSVYVFVITAFDTRTAENRR